MRTSLLFFVFITAGACCTGQVPNVPAGSAWSHVQALTAGTSIQVQGRTKLNCRLQSVDAESLACNKGSRTVVFPRAEIIQVQIIKRGLSTALAAGIGAGAGFGIDEALSVPIFKGGHVKGSVAVAATAVGAVILAPVGYFGGWIRDTVYTKP